MRHHRFAFRDALPKIAENAHQQSVAIDGLQHQPLVAGAELRTAYFPLDGDSLWFGTFHGGPGLFRMALGGGAREEIALPPLRLDAVAFIAQNPVRQAEFTIVTFERAVFVTPDRGGTWTRIARARGTLPQD